MAEVCCILNPYFFNRLTCAILTPRRQQEVGQSPSSFYSLPNLPPLRPASAQHSSQRPQTGPESAAGCSHGGPGNRDPSAHSGCNHPSPDRTGLPTGRGACLSPHPPATAHTSWLSHAGLQDRECCAHCWDQSRSSDRLVLLLSLGRGHCTFSELTLLCVSV